MAHNSKKAPNAVTTMGAAQARDVLTDGIFGLMAGLMTVPDPIVVKLMEVVPERGEALWVRFTTWRNAQPKADLGDNPFLKWVGITVFTAMIG